MVLGWQTCLSLASTLLGTCIFSTTFPAHHAFLRWVRLAVAVPALVLALASAYTPNPPQYVPEPSNHIQIFSISSFILMRILEVCAIGFFEGSEECPRWQVVKEKKDGSKGTVETFVKLPLPTTFQGRLAYTVDNFFSMQGESFFRGCTWDWARKEIRDFRPTNLIATRIQAVRTTVITFILYDATEFIFHSRKWDLKSPNPLTSLSLPEQIFYSVTLGTFICVATDLPLALRRTVLWTVFPPAMFPPVFIGNPLTATSLVDMWSHRWHAIFRRSFDRLSLPVVWMTNRYQKYMSRRMINFIRCFTVFSLSAILHVAVASCVPPKPHITRRLFEPSLILFFLVQPLGLLFEVAVVFPATEGMPERWRSVVRRTYLWVWMIWTGRWFTDAYLLHGQFDHRGMEFSPVARLMKWWDS
ncbi:hypothetical protein FRB95_013945 [Tulasnella sp. JGI-2019a]|nr:hypothetical protein FRB95_013945 [Tulasnella sp. JGI-2019a]